MVTRSDGETSNGPDGRAVLRWVLAGLLALVALIGAVSVVTVMVWAAEEVPGWVTLLIGGGLALGTAAFAWVIASALRSSERSKDG